MKLDQLTILEYARKGAYEAIIESDLQGDDPVKHRQMLTDLTEIERRIKQRKKKQNAQD